MKSLALVLVAGLASSAWAADRSLSLTPALGQAAPTAELTPVPDQAYVVAPSTTGPVMAVQGAPLYGNVKYRDQRNIAPCAVSKIIQVPDPCDPCCCVNVEICVPPCACECVKVSRCGTKVKYDYGKYEVEVTSRRGRVVVNYND